jgi:hypothetical protein
LTFRILTVTGTAKLIEKASFNQNLLKVPNNSRWSQLS